MMRPRITSVGNAADIMIQIDGLRADVDVLLRQLGQGEYASVDTFVNNWLHLTHMYEQIQAHMNDRALMDMLVHTDILLAADLMATGRLITVMNNFLRCAQIK